MKILKLGKNDFDEVVAATSECLESGGIVVAPTETVYGLMTLWDNGPGRARIYAMKGRDESKPLQMLAAGESQASRSGAIVFDDPLRLLIDRFCPGPLTVVVRGYSGSVGLRIPDHPFILAVLRSLGVPLAATSANLSGSPPATTAGEAVEELLAPPELLIDGGPVAGGAASTVVSLLGPAPRLIREGPVAFAEIEKALQS